MVQTPSPDCSGESDGRGDEWAARHVVRNRRSRHPQADRVRRFLSVGIPALTVAVLVVYLLIWWANNADPALRAGPADQLVLRQVTGIPLATWQTAGAGGLSSPWHRIAGQPALEGPNGRPELFYVGGEFCEFCATERWAMVIALGRFGSFGQLRQLRSYNQHIATYTFYQSTYVSPYVDFVPVEHVGNAKDIWGQYVALQPFLGNQQHLYETYASEQYLPTSGGLPFIDLGNRYLLGGGRDPAIFRNAAHEPLSWQQIAQALTDPASPLGRDTLGTANFLTVAICMVTDQQPVSVCQAPVIQRMEAGL